MERPRKGSIWRNLRRGTIYRVTGFSFNATNSVWEGEEVMVKYVPAQYIADKAQAGHLGSVDCDDYSRNLEEFMEKFEPFEER